VQGDVVKELETRACDECGGCVCGEEFVKGKGRDDLAEVLVDLAEVKEGADGEVLDDVLDGFDGEDAQGADAGFRGARKRGEEEVAGWGRERRVEIGEAGLAVFGVRCGRGQQGVDVGDGIGIVWLLRSVFWGEKQPFVDGVEDLLGDAHDGGTIQGGTN